MRRFFISGFERLLSVLTVLSALAVAALAARITVEAQPGDTRQYLTAAAVLAGGWLAVVMLAGVGFLALAMHDNSRRLIALTASVKAARPLTASRKPERSRPAPEIAVTEIGDEGWDDIAHEEPTPAPRPVQTRSAQAPAAPPPVAETQPAPQRPVFSGRAMPRVQAESAPVPQEISAPQEVSFEAVDSVATQAPMKKAPVDPAPSAVSAAPTSAVPGRAARLVAERRFPR